MTGASEEGWVGIKPEEDGSRLGLVCNIFLMMCKLCDRGNGEKGMDFLT